MSSKQLGSINTQTVGKRGLSYDRVQPGEYKVECFVILVPLSVHGDVVRSATILVFIPMSLSYRPMAALLR